MTYKGLGLWKVRLPVCAGVGGQAVEAQATCTPGQVWFHLPTCHPVSVPPSAASARESALCPHLTSDMAFVKRDL